MSETIETQLAPVAESVQDPEDSRVEMVLGRVRDGQSVFSACRDAGTPWRTWWDWMDADRWNLTHRYMRAREAQAWATLGFIDDKSRQLLTDPACAQYANAWRVGLDALKWVGARLHPTLLGEHKPQDITINQVNDYRKVIVLPAGEASPFGNALPKGNE